MYPSLDQLIHFYNGKFNIQSVILFQLNHSAVSVKLTKYMLIEQNCFSVVRYRQFSPKLIFNNHDVTKHLE